MHRASFRLLIEKYRPSNTEEESNRQRTITFVKEHNDCFDRSCVPGHITGSSWLLNRFGTHVLLIQHRKLNMWIQTGGHCDGETDVLAVSIREAQEESGIQNIKVVSEDIFDLDIHRIPERPGEPAHLHYDVTFLLQVQDDSPCVQNHEANALKWFDKNPDNFPLSENSMRRMFYKWCNI